MNLWKLLFLILFMALPSSAEAGDKLYAFYSPNEEWRHEPPPARLKIPIISPVYTPGTVRWQEADLRNFVLQVAVQHPSRRLRETFIHKVESGEITLTVNAGEIPTASATFSVSSGGQPTINITPSLILQTNTRADLLGFFLTLDHEFVHYEQWVLAGKPLPKRFRNIRKQCERLWWMEREAYSLECIPAKRWSTTTDVCYASSDRDFSETIYIIEMMHPSVKRMCDKQFEGYIYSY